jgi:hypothetical protein
MECLGSQRLRLLLRGRVGRPGQALGVLNRCPQVMHFMFTRAAGPACVNGWVFADPQTGHGGRGSTRRASAGRPREGSGMR